MIVVIDSMIQLQQIATIFSIVWCQPTVAGWENVYLGQGKSWEMVGNFITSNWWEPCMQTHFLWNLHRPFPIGHMHNPFSYELERPISMTYTQALFLWVTKAHFQWLSQRPFSYDTHKGLFPLTLTEAFFLWHSQRPFSSDNLKYPFPMTVTMWRSYLRFL